MFSEICALCEVVTVCMPDELRTKKKETYAQIAAFCTTWDLTGDYIVFWVIPMIGWKVRIL